MSRARHKKRGPSAGRDDSIQPGRASHEEAAPFLVVFEPGVCPRIVFILRGQPPVRPPAYAMPALCRPGREIEARGGPQLPGRRSGRRKDAEDMRPCLETKR